MPESTTLYIHIRKVLNFHDRQTRQFALDLTLNQRFPYGTIYGIVRQLDWFGKHINPHRTHTAQLAEHRD